jgi:hypothetical protein
MSNLPIQAPIQETLPAVVVRGRPRKTIEQQIIDIKNKTAIDETKRKIHNDIMKKYYQTNKEKILEKKKLMRAELRETKSK